MSHDIIYLYPATKNQPAEKNQERTCAIKFDLF